MGYHQLKHAGVALCALGAASCAYLGIDQKETEGETPPFIDPVTLSQSKCSGVKNPILPPVATNVAFDFGAPFALPEAVSGHFHYPVTTESEAAQAWFDTGLAHMANFNHDEAIAAFRKAQEEDPDCAMCYWGEGLSFGSNINAPYEPPRGAAGRVAADKALALIDAVSDKEAALIAALDTRYAPSEDGVMLENAAAYADAMDAVAEKYPRDKFILALAAEANMDTQPWDYWEASARLPKGRTARTLELLETALEIDPEFAPSIHLYIHTTESSIDPFRAEAYADTLHENALGVGHLVHMPSHIYLRLGRWRKSLEANIAAIEADEQYIAEAGNADFYGAVYYPHNVHFVVSNSQLAGDEKTALAMAAKLDDIVEIDPSAPAPLVEHVAAASTFVALQFADDETVLNAPEPPAPHLFLRTAWRYSRGAALARQGKIERAGEELAALEALSEADGFEMYDAYGAPMAALIDVARLTLKGRIQYAEGDLDAAIDTMGAAAEAQERLPYFEPTWWYYPTRQTLGAYLLADGQYDRAEREFFKTLINSPNNAYALFGLAETYKAQNKDRSEAHARHLFNEAWIGEDGHAPALSDL